MKVRARVLMLALVAGFFALPTASASAADAAPTLKLSLSRPIYTSGQTARITVQVEAANLDYTIYFQTQGSSEWKYLNGRSPVNEDTFTESLYVGYNLKVRARLTDPEDGNAIKAETTRSIPVRAGVGTVPLGNYSASGKYAVFGKGKSPLFRSQATPNLPVKRCLRHQVQRHYASGWKTVKTSACRVLDKKSRVDWRWAGKHASKVKFRVRATFAGDAYNESGASAWEYLRFR